MIGVLGATGAVGAAAVRTLRDRYPGRLRLAGRRTSPSTIDGEDPVRLDLHDPVAVRDFCAGCAVVLNCAGPSYRILDRAARAALGAGADYVDTAGDEPAHRALCDPPVQQARELPGGRVAVLSAGAMPGVSGLLARWLAGLLPEPARRLTGYAGGRYRFTPASAADFVAALGTGPGLPLAAWRDGAARPGALAARTGADLPAFDGPVTATPYLTGEVQRLAATLGLTGTDWYTVFDGSAVPAVLRGRDPRPGQLIAAAATDLAGRSAYLALSVCLVGAGGATRTAVLRTPDPAGLTGAMAALTTLAVRAGRVPAGVHYAAEALDPAGVLELLPDPPAGATLVTTDRAADRIEEGVL